MGFCEESWSELCYTVNECRKRLCSSECAFSIYKENPPFTCHGMTYERYVVMWARGMELIQDFGARECFYNQDCLNQLFLSTAMSNIELFSSIRNDLETILILVGSTVGMRVFHDLLESMERLLVLLLGHNSMEVRSWATIMLNNLYDGHTWQAASPFSVVIEEVNRVMEIQFTTTDEYNDEDLMLYVSTPFYIPSDDSTTLLKPRMMTHFPLCHTKLGERSDESIYQPREILHFDSPGCYDWCIVHVSTERILKKGRYIIHSSIISNLSIYEIPLEKEMILGGSSSRSSFAFIQEEVTRIKEKNVTGLYLSSSIPADSPRSFKGSHYNDVSTDSDKDELSDEAKVFLESADSSPTAAAEDDSRNYALETRMSNSSPLLHSIDYSNSQYGSKEEYRFLLNELHSQSIELIVPINACVEATKMASGSIMPVFTISPTTKEIHPHPGTDGNENEWKSEILPNYRLISTWNNVISEMIRIMEIDGVRVFFLLDGQSWPIILKKNSDHLTTRPLVENMEGSVVYPSEESGYWDCSAAMELFYPNPFLIKLTRKMQEVNSSCTIISSCYWDRCDQLLLSQCIPCCNDLLKKLCELNHTVLYKNGLYSKVERVYKEDLNDVMNVITHHSLLHRIKNKNRSIIHYLCNDTTPYPSVLLNRSLWPSVVLLFTLESLQLCYYKEDEGRSVKITMGEEFEVSQKSIDSVEYLEEGPVIHEDTTLLSLSKRKRVVSFCYECDEATTEVFLTGSFNEWKTHQDSMILKKTENGKNTFELYLELYAGLYYYKFFIPALNSYIYDPANGKKVDDGYGSFNSVLEIPITEHTQHPLLQSAQMRADVWWTDIEESYVQPDQPQYRPYRNLSYSNLGLLSDITKSRSVISASTDKNLSMKHVTSWTRIHSTGSSRSHSPSYTSSSTPSFSLSYTELDKLNDLESSVREMIGPQYGFDLKHIESHYQFCRDMRRNSRSLQYGALHPIQIQSTALRVLSFCRYVDNEIFIVVATFESEPCFVTLQLSEILYAIECLCWNRNRIITIDGNRELKGLWVVTHLNENKEAMWNTAELKTKKIRRSLLPYDYWLIKMEYRDTIPTEQWVEYHKQGLKDLQSIVVQSRNYGQQFYQGNHVWNRQMKAEKEIIEELLNNSLFAQTMGKLKRIKESTNKKEQMESLLGWYMDTCKSCEGIYDSNAIPLETDVVANSLIFKELLFYSSIVLNDTAQSLTAYNDMLLAMIRELTSSDSPVSSFASQILNHNSFGPIAIITPELGKWSTVGGLGVMVDNLSKALALQNQDVIVFSPYYDKNRHGKTDYLKEDGFEYMYNLPITLPNGDTIDVGYHKGYVNNINYVFFHYASVFMRPYPSGSPSFMMLCEVLMALAPLTYLVHASIRPSIVLTNDWPCGLVSAYAHMLFPSPSFASTSFFHIFHNLDESYEGRIYPNEGDEALYSVHHLPSHLLRDPYWKTNIVNPSRCALLTIDNWGTVSNTYQCDIMNSSPLSPLLKRFPQPFSSPNGVFVFEKKMKYQLLPTRTHDTAKLFVQKKYFGVENLSIPLLVFVGRITEQKGVHLICEIAEELIVAQNRNIQIIVGGIANENDPYGRYCINRINHLCYYYSDCFWAHPYEFFTDGFVCNLAADYGLMPSLFEPCGIVQDEFFVAGTPVIGFNTGGLKETIRDWDDDVTRANGFLFSNYSSRELIHTVNRALYVFYNHADYAKLRKSTVTTTINVVNQARDYISEFYRLRRCILPSVSTLFVYRWENAPFPNQVILTGSFNDWNKEAIRMTYDPAKKGYTAALNLPAGDYRYKFIVDNEWKTSEWLEVFTDENKNSNHVISIPSSTNVSVFRVISDLKE